MIDYLKTTYYIPGPLFLSTQVIFKDFPLTDELKNKATLEVIWRIEITMGFELP